MKSKKEKTKNNDVLEQLSVPQSEANNKKNSKGKAVKASDGVHIPRTVQESIPYIRVFENGMIEVSPGRYSKSYLLDDINFQIASQEEQETIFLAYSDLLNTFPADVSIQVSINNRNIDIEDFQKKVLISPQKDSLNYLREEYNDMLIKKMSEGRNNMVREKYVTLSFDSPSVEEAISKFARLDQELSDALKKITNNATEPMSTVARLSVLHDLYNPGTEQAFYRKVRKDKHEVETFNFDEMINMGICTKDLVGPDSLEFNKDHFITGDKYGRVLFLDNLPNFLTTNILTDFTESPCNMLVSVMFQPLAQDKALKLVRKQVTNINSNVADAQRKAAKRGISADLISPELLRAQYEANKLLEDMVKRNQKLFLATMLIVHFADSIEELNKDTDALVDIASKNLCQLRKFNFQQEAALASVLPLANNKVFVKRMLTSESASVFIPYAAQELVQNNGMYYGLNAVSKNMILFNRLNSKNQNGVILGTPGSGKSFSAKREIVNVLLNTNDDVFILDPEREYTPLADIFEGEVVRIAAGSRTYLNPLDMDLNYADEDDPITLKSDFIGSLCETVIGGRYGLTPAQKAIIDRCVRAVYQPYVDEMRAAQSSGSTKSFDADKVPTLLDFYQLLMSQEEADAQSIALSLELYCTGSLDTFAHRSNVTTNSRFVIYDIKDIGSGMKEMGLQVCLDHIWNKMIENKRLGKRTWFYIDEFYLMTQTESSAKFLQQIWKRARKWGGVPTGITQNVADLLASQEARAIIANSDFVLMLNQAPLDRKALADMFHLSPTQESFVTNADSGSGLLYDGRMVIPFVDKFPTDTKLYKAMSTKVGE